METSDDSRPVTHADLARMTDQITDQITTAVDGRLAKNESLIKALMEARDPSNDAEISRLNRKVAELEMMLAAPEGTRDVHPTVEGSLPGSPTVAASSEVSVGDSAYRSNRNTPQRSSRGTSMASDAPEDGQAAATPYIHVDASTQTEDHIEDDKAGKVEKEQDVAQKSQEDDGAREGDQDDEEDQGSDSDESQDIHEGDESDGNAEEDVHTALQLYHPSSHKDYNRVLIIIVLVTMALYTAAEQTQAAGAEKIAESMDGHSHYEPFLGLEAPPAGIDFAASDDVIQPSDGYVQELLQDGHSLDEAPPAGNDSAASHDVIQTSEEVVQNPFQDGLSYEKLVLVPEAPPAGNDAKLSNNVIQASDGDSLQVSIYSSPSTRTAMVATNNPPFTKRYTVGITAQKSSISLDIVISTLALSYTTSESPLHLPNAPLEWRVLVDGTLNGITPPSVVLQVLGPTEEFPLINIIIKTSDIQRILELVLYPTGRAFGGYLEATTKSDGRSNYQKVYNVLDRLFRRFGNFRFDDPQTLPLLNYIAHAIGYSAVGTLEEGSASKFTDDEIVAKPVAEFKTIKMQFNGVLEHMTAGWENQIKLPISLQLTMPTSEQVPARTSVLQGNEVVAHRPAPTPNHQRQTPEQDSVADSSVSKHKPPSFAGITRNVREYPTNPSVFQSMPLSRAEMQVVKSTESVERDPGTDEQHIDAQQPDKKKSKELQTIVEQQDLPTSETPNGDLVVNQTQPESVGDELREDSQVELFERLRRNENTAHTSTATSKASAGQVHDGNNSPDPVSTHNKETGEELHAGQIGTQQDAHGGDMQQQYCHANTQMGADEDVEEQQLETPTVGTQSTQAITQQQREIHASTLKVHPLDETAHTLATAETHNSSKSPTDEVSYEDLHQASSLALTASGEDSRDTKTDLSDDAGPSKLIDESTRTVQRDELFRVLTRRTQNAVTPNIRRRDLLDDDELCLSAFHYEQDIFDAHSNSPIGYDEYTREISRQISEWDGMTEVDWVRKVSDEELGNGQLSPNGTGEAAEAVPVISKGKEPMIGLATATIGSSPKAASGETSGQHIDSQHPSLMVPAGAASTDTLVSGSASLPTLQESSPAPTTGGIITAAQQKSYRARIQQAIELNCSKLVQGETVIRNELETAAELVLSCILVRCYNRPSEFKKQAEGRIREFQSFAVNEWERYLRDELMPSLEKQKQDERRLPTSLLSLTKKIGDWNDRVKLVGMSNYWIGDGALLSEIISCIHDDFLEKSSGNVKICKEFIDDRFQNHTLYTWIEHSKDIIKQLVDSGDPAFAKFVLERPAFLEKGLREDIVNNNMEDVAKDEPANGSGSKVSSADEDVTMGNSSASDEESQEDAAEDRKSRGEDNNANRESLRADDDLSMESDHGPVEQAQERAQEDDADTNGESSSRPNADGTQASEDTEMGADTNGESSAQAQDEDMSDSDASLPAAVRSPLKRKIGDEEEHDFPPPPKRRYLGPFRPRSWG